MDSKQIIAPKAEAKANHLRVDNLSPRLLRQLLGQEEVAKGLSTPHMRPQKGAHGRLHREDEVSELLHLHSHALRGFTEQE